MCPQRVPDSYGEGQIGRCGPKKPLGTSQGFPSGRPRQPPPWSGTQSRRVSGVTSVPASAVARGRISLLAVGVAGRAPARARGRTAPRRDARDIGAAACATEARACRAAGRSLRGERNRSSRLTFRPKPDRCLWSEPRPSSTVGQ